MELSNTFVLLSGVILLILTLWFWRKRYVNALSHFPGPVELPIVGNVFQIDWSRPRLTFFEWSKTYGTVYKVRLPFGPVIMASDYDSIHQVLISRGNDFSNRMRTCFRIKYISDYDAVIFKDSDVTWKTLRKLSHGYLKQFGSGMSRLEAILSEASHYMVREFKSKRGIPIDSLDTLKTTALSSISVLLLGQAPTQDDAIFHTLMKYEREFVHYLGLDSVPLLLLDTFPFLIHLPFSKFAEVKEFVRYQDHCWEQIKEMQSHSTHESLSKLLLKNVGEGGITERQAALTSLALIFAGVHTTSITLHMLLNTLAFKVEIQEKIRQEISDAIADGKSGDITLEHKARMPYLRATILECLRHYTTATLGALPHVANQDTELTGYGPVPKGTIVFINTWALHHDESFWDEPYKFCPGRFLDKNGDVVPADHPNRKHLLPFGAGPRVCLGETFAMARLFLWTAAVIQNFHITPAPESDPGWTDPRVHQDNVLIKPLPNKIIFTPAASA